MSVKQSVGHNSLSLVDNKDLHKGEIIPLNHRMG